MNPQPTTAQTLTDLGAAIVETVTANPTAIQVAGAVVQFEPSLEAAVRAFIALFKRHSAQTATAQAPTVAPAAA